MNEVNLNEVSLRHTAMDSAELLALIAESSSSESPTTAAPAKPLSASELSELFRSVGGGGADDECDDVATGASRAGKLPRSGGGGGRASKPKRPPSSYSNKSRDGRREELAYLRKSAADLEARLESLLEAAAISAATATLTPESATALAATAASTRAAKNAANQTLHSGDNALWREIARRQGDERAKSERENVRLKLVLESQLKVARSLEKFLQLKASATTTVLYLWIRASLMLEVWVVVADDRCVGTGDHQVHRRAARSDAPPT